MNYLPNVPGADGRLVGLFSRQLTENGILNLADRKLPKPDCREEYCVARRGRALKKGGYCFVRAVRPGRKNDVKTRKTAEKLL